ALLAAGASVKTVCEAAELLRREGCDPTVVNMRFIKPLDEELLRELAKEHRLLVTAEENISAGGLGEAVQRFVAEENLPVRVLGACLPDAYIRYGTVDSQRRQTGLDPESIARKVLNALKDCNEE
ncbi:MAG: 1-deoxy-D-xylulose-5-phosphate synthase, partial [Eubacterium sp.]|nr:1-deoxy-D-xylulose-5-phosphate synthase [Eubacterium sp.]